MREGGGSIVAYEAWLETGDEDAARGDPRLQRGGLRVDRLAARLARRAMRPEAAAEYGVDFDELAKPADDEEYLGPGVAAEMPDADRSAERRACRAAVDDDDTDQAVRRLLAELLLYHYRESKPEYWRWFDLKAKTPAELVGEREAVGLARLRPGDVVRPSRTRSRSTGRTDSPRRRSSSSPGR